MGYRSVVQTFSQRVRKPWLAAGLALAFGLMLYRYLGALEQQAQQRTQVIGAAVLVCDVPAGTVITQQMLATEALPASELPINWIDGLSAIGAVAALDLAAGTVLTQDKVSFPQQESGDTSSVSELTMEHSGKSFTVSVSAAEARNLGAGDLVDLLAVFPARGRASDQSVLIARSVPVVGVSGVELSQEDSGQTYGGYGEGSARLTVAADDETVHRLALADAFGRIRVVQLGVSDVGPPDEREAAGLTLDSILHVDKASLRWMTDDAFDRVETGETSNPQKEADDGVTVIRGTKVTKVRVP